MRLNCTPRKDGAHTGHTRLPRSGAPAARRRNHAAGAAAPHRALDSAHPILAVISRLAAQPSVADSEHFAILVLYAGRQLAVLLSDCAQAVTKENIDPDDDAPF